MDIFQAVIFSFVEGLTEFLPISSTGHLILTAKILGIPQSEFVKTFEISIQFGAILGALFLYGKKFIKEPVVLMRVFFAFIPTGVIGFIFYKMIRTFLIGSTEITLISLFLGGILILLFEKHFKTHEGGSTVADLSITQSLAIGAVQSISAIPGISRSAATIFGGMFAGLKREEAVEFSFMLAIPTLAVAAGYDFLKTSSALEPGEVYLMLIGLLAAFLTSIIAIKWLLRFVSRNDLSIFGYYRIGIAIIFLLFVYNF